MHTWGSVPMTELQITKLKSILFAGCNRHSASFGLLQNSIVPTPSPFTLKESLGKCDGSSDGAPESLTFEMGRRPTRMQLTFEWNAEPFLLDVVASGIVRRNVNGPTEVVWADMFQVKRPLSKISSLNLPIYGGREPLGEKLQPHCNLCYFIVFTEKTVVNLHTKITLKRKCH
ncbi:hypothetical protein CEXT_497081 [Caerostris extrusa]|uniref:Uncharacterized protein n=1 Tax=Caerostris extrusa TaxID=172846 RepID=A0AAV4V209_CAEEX|nr:hypothetical protein CEXT_497081 [Caerostris extrusa]